MSFLLPLFIVSTLILLALLIWAVRPDPVRFKSDDEVFEVLSATRHYYRLPQIVLALKDTDTEFLVERKANKLARRLQAERREIASQFLDMLELDYRNLIEASRVLTSMAPEVLPGQEWQRLRLSMAFRWSCMILRFRLRAGLKPWSGFAKISERASLMSYRLEEATRRIGERAMLASKFSSLLEDRGGEPR